MPRAPVFEELLDDQLRNECGDARAMRGPARGGTATAFGFFLGGAPDSVTGLPVNHAGRQRDAIVSCESRFAGAVSAPWTGVQVPTPSPDKLSAFCHDRRSARREPRAMSARERQAFEDLVLLGARLGADFTFDELRSAFRALALTYHPDRHTQCSATKRAHFAGLFARAHDAYRVLARCAAGPRH